MARGGVTLLPGLSVRVDGDPCRAPFVLMWDATGFGKLQLSTMAMRNPFAVQSGTHLHILAVGNCGDGKAGAGQLLYSARRITS